jgi:hypothetical protein
MVCFEPDPAAASQILIHYNTPEVKSRNKNDEPIHCCYIYHDPERDHPIYVGEGSLKRSQSHLKVAQAGKPSRKRFINRLKTILSLGLKPRIDLVASGLTKSEALDIEEDLIKRYGRIIDGGVLYNVSPRGFLNACKPLTEEQRKAVSEYWKDRPKTEEHRKRISASLKGRKTGSRLTDSGRTKISSVSSKPKSPETKERMRLSQLSSDNPRRGQKRSEAQKTALSPIRKVQLRWSQPYLLVSGDTRVCVLNLDGWCKEHNMSVAALRGTLRTKKPCTAGASKGYQLFKIPGAPKRLAKPA